jgi:hypothetical protein
MKAILEFNLPEEDEEYRHAVHGIDYSIVIDEIDNYLRGQLKYNCDNLSEEVQAALQLVRDKLWEEMNERGLRS